MPITDFLNNPANQIDPFGTYVLKGSTLRELLMELSFSDTDFDVAEENNRRTVSLKSKGAESAASATIEIVDCSSSELVTLRFKDGLLVSPNGSHTIQAGCDGYYWSAP